MNVAIMTPVRRDGDEWQCAVDVHGGGRHAAGAVSGADSLQALCLALQFVAAHLRAMIRDGNRLRFMPARDDDATLDDVDWPIDAYFGDIMQVRTTP